MFEQSLGVEEPWYVDRAEFIEGKGEVHVYIRTRDSAMYNCPVCDAECKRYDNEDKERVWRHGDVAFYPCYIHCRRPRTICSEHKVRVVDAPWARRKSGFTLMFEGYALFLMQNMPIAKVAKLLKCSHTALTNMLQYWVEKAVAEDDLSEVDVLCIDETSHRKGHKYVTVIIDGRQRRVIGVEDGKDSKTIEKFSLKFEEKGGDCNNVKQVSTDMSKAFLSAREMCFPNSISVIDKFHVKKLVLEGMEKVRREEQDLSRKSSKGVGRKLLMIPKKRQTEQQEEAIIKLCNKYKKTGRAYSMVQSLDDFYNSFDEDEAERKLKKLISWMKHSRLEPMKSVASTLSKYSREILAYFASRLTNAIAEGINSLIQAAKRKARGYKTFRGFACMIYLIAGKLKLSCPSPI